MLVAAFLNHVPLQPEGRRSDAIVICGGGLNPDGTPLPWVLGRLDAAINRSAEADYFVALSRGTTHDSPPLNSQGFPIDEAQASSAYLAQHGIDSSRIVQDTW